MLKFLSGILLGVFLSVPLSWICFVDYWNEEVLRIESIVIKTSEENDFLFYKLKEALLISEECMRGYWSEVTGDEDFYRDEISIE